MQGYDARCWLHPLNTQLHMQVVEHNKRTALLGEWSADLVYICKMVLHHPILLLMAQHGQVSIIGNLCRPSCRSDKPVSQKKEMRVNGQYRRTGTGFPFMESAEQPSPG